MASVAFPPPGIFSSFASESKWNIHDDMPDRMIVNGIELRKSPEDPALFRREFFSFLQQLGIEPTHVFPAFGGMASAVEPVDFAFLPPRFSDIISLLEHHRKIVLRDNANPGFEKLLAWVVNYYMPVEDGAFMLYDAAGKEMGTCRISLFDLLSVYGFRLITTSAAFPQFAVFSWRTDPPLVKIQQLNGTFCKIPFTWEPFSLEDYKAKVYNSLSFTEIAGRVERQLRGLIEEYQKNPNASLSKDWAELIQAADEKIIPFCPENEPFLEVYKHAGQIVGVVSRFQSREKRGREENGESMRLKRARPGDMEVG